MNWMNKEILNAVEESNRKLMKQMKKMERTTNERLERLERLAMMHSYGVTETKRETQLVVAMTSYGSRVAIVPKVLERLTNQTVKPDRIVLYLSVENFPNREDDLPQLLLDMRMLGVEIHWCEGDIRSFKKLIPPLLEYPEDIIITVDDDLYYDLDVIERLIDSYRRFPQAISALRAHKMEFDDNGALLPYEQWTKCVSEPLATPSMRLFATTGGGTLFPPHILPEETWKDSRFMDLCPNADDVWVKFMSVLNRVPVVLVSPDRKLQYVPGTQEESLWKSNKQENDGQIKAVLDAFQDVRIDGKTILEYILEG